MIHYHGTPFSGRMTNALELQGKHAMVSFAHPDQVEVVAEVCQSFTLDNGAFSNWKSGTPTDWDAFGRWARQWLKHPACDWALIPDVIDGTEHDNDALLLEYVGPGWVPIWHLHESLRRLERLVHTYPRVAFGSSGEFAQVGAGDWWVRMAEAMDVATTREGYPLTRLHGLRMLDPTIFSYFPFSSADSTNVARNMGIDQAWSGPYSPRSKRMRAAILMERIEAHASAARWNREGWRGVRRNHELFG